MTQTLQRKSRSSALTAILYLCILAAILSGVAVGIAYLRRPPERPVVNREAISYQEKKPIDTGGFTAVLPTLDRWPPTASLEEIGGYFKRVGFRNIEKIDQQLAQPGFPDDRRVVFELAKASLFNYEAEPGRAYEVLEQGTDLARRARAAGRAMALHRHLLPGSDRPSPGRERQLHHVPGRKLVHPADLAGGDPHQALWLAAGDRAFHASTSIAFPKTWKRSGS